MKITKRQLRRIIREETAKATKQYDDDSALKGDQDKLPDKLQKGIIDKTVEDREEAKDEKTNEVRRLVRQMLREELVPAVTDDEFAEALRRTWDAVAIDVDIRNPTWEEKGDEAMAMFGTYEPGLADQFNALPFKEQDMLLRLAFDPQEAWNSFWR
jgi:hypothetical protein